MSQVGPAVPDTQEKTSGTAGPTGQMKRVGRKAWRHLEWSYGGQRADEVIGEDAGAGAQRSVPFVCDALEHRRRGRLPMRLNIWRRFEADALYCVAYQQAAQVHELAGENRGGEEGISRWNSSRVAQGRSACAEEMESALAMLE